MKHADLLAKTSDWHVGQAQSLRFSYPHCTHAALLPNTSILHFGQFQSPVRPPPSATLSPTSLSASHAIRHQFCRRSKVGTKYAPTASTARVDSARTWNGPWCLPTRQGARVLIQLAWQFAVVEFAALGAVGTFHSRVSTRALRCSTGGAEARHKHVCNGGNGGGRGTDTSTKIGK